MSDDPIITELIIVRHGNTFNPGEPARRIGKRTDLHLSDSGREQAVRLGQLWAQRQWVPDRVYCSTLARTRETAELALMAMGIKRPILPLEGFDEVDYGPDEDKPESEVVARLGKEAIAAWEEHSTVPDGWSVDADAIRAHWHEFIEKAAEDGQIETGRIIVVTSNGITRFAPALLGENVTLPENQSPKMATAAFGQFVREGGGWKCVEWNVRA